MQQHLRDVAHETFERWLPLGDVGRAPDFHDHRVRSVGGRRGSDSSRALRHLLSRVAALRARGPRHARRPPAEPPDPPGRSVRFLDEFARHAARICGAHLAAERRRMNPRPMMGSKLGPKPPPRGIDLPCDDGEPLETSRHRDQMILLIQSLRAGWRDRHDFYVSGNMFLYYSETQTKRYDYRGPDVFVVLDTDDHERRSWVVWEEDGRAPNAIIEITSDTTEHIDRGPKMRIYGNLLRVPFYAIFDPFSARLDGFRLNATNGEYEPIPKDERGYVRCEALQLWLGVVPGYLESYRVEAPWLRWIDNDGRVLRDPTERAAEEAERAAREAERAAREAERANAAEAENARLRAELERLKKP